VHVPGPADPPTRHMALPFSRAGYACHSSREEGSRI
jgi:hypothetical protein